MEYEHSAEIKMFRQTVREFVDKEIRPIARLSMKKSGYLLKR
jgi:Acyl-CoA dehydrogenase, N-terminal domain.